MASYLYLVCLTGLAFSSRIAAGNEIHSKVPTTCPPNQTITRREKGIIAIGDSLPVNLLLSGLVLNDQFINASGIYLLTVPQSGTVTSVNFQGFTDEENVQIILTRQMPFFLTLHLVLYRIEGDRHLLMQGPLEVSHEAGATGMVPNLNWNVRAGDSIGVIIPATCNRTNDSMMCPCQVNLRTSQCLSARYHPLQEDFNVLLTDDLQDVLVNLNTQFTVKVEDVSTGDGDRSEAATIALGVVLAVTILVCFGLLLAIIIIVFVVKTKCQRKDAIARIDIEGKTEIYSRSKSPEYHEYNEVSDNNDGYEKNGHFLPNIIQNEQLEDKKCVYQATSTPVTPYSGWGEVEPYFEPASSKLDIIRQLKDELCIPVEKVDNLKFKKILGSGEFGTVYKAIWRQEDKDSDTHTEKEVAVKTVDKDVGQEEMVKFLQEAAIMGQFNHPSIVKILGIVVEDPVMIIIDLMKGGDLRNHLLNKRQNLANFEIQEIQGTLLSYSRQICCAMTLMEKKGYIHRDLAARNILISGDGSNVKISDFGLSRDLQSEDHYISHGGKVPVKWTAPEALQFRLYSHESDVWSFGCVLYEIWSMGYKPFHDWDNHKVIKEVAKGYRLPPPPGCPRLIYEVMIRCWHPDAKERGGFNLIPPHMLKPDFMIFKWSEGDTNKYDEELRTLGAPLEKGQQLFKELQHAYIKTKAQENV